MAPCFPIHAFWLRRWYASRGCAQRSRPASTGDRSRPFTILTCAQLLPASLYSACKRTNALSTRKAYKKLKAFKISEAIACPSLFTSAIRQGETRNYPKFRQCVRHAKKASLHQTQHLFPTQRRQLKKNDLSSRDVCGLTSGRKKGRPSAHIQAFDGTVESDVEG